ncbi:hypothetical protein FQV27_16550 [Paracoccus aurantiacus]|uniref:Cytochrome P460 domain-containing protein n=1 Tax=Paracoccus aurantiacus TaxID=2599412 RepID=A0A5C6RWB1_9RHOB|nr:cytochrome P460 family protein [Paracoccus aurantiacus]TXB65662.1 hypothetical protein FQV27_16550 [Paracoccus aurantiacus]
MKIFQAILPAALTLGLTHAALAEPNRVEFPDNLGELALYTTVARGDIFENVYTSQEALDAIQQNDEPPYGTQIVLEIFRDDALWRYFVMQNGEGWGDEYDETTRTGDWQFQWYWPDGTINTEENTERCRACHQSREGRSYMFTYNDARRFE